jgi:CRISPR-associated protein Cas6
VREAVTEAVAGMIDLAYMLPGGSVPREHRRALAEAVERVLPWLAEEPGAGVHRLNVAAGAGAEALLSRHTRLTLRVPRARAADAGALVGAELMLYGRRLHVGAMQPRELRPHGTLYAHLVASDDGDDELEFLRAARSELESLHVSCRTICGRHQVTEEGALRGFSLMLDGLSPAGALRALDSGLGRHRLLGCGLFVPHRAAAPVGASS